MTPDTTTKRSKFRTHQGPTPPIASPLFRKLVGEWISLNTDPTATAEIHRMGQKQPILANLNTPGEIVDAIDAADQDTTDAMLAALLLLFQNGHHLAGRLVLHQFLPLIASLTYTRQQGSRTEWAEDRRHIAIAEFWTVATEVNPESDHVVCDIYWRLRRACNKAFINTPEIPAGDASDILKLRGNADLNLPLARPSHQADEDDIPLRSDSYRLAPILNWARNAGLITQAEADLLTTIYIDGNRVKNTAAEMGLNPNNVSQRCRRAVKRIRDHAEQIPTPAAIA
jgi:hypothetical protein